MRGLLLAWIIIVCVVPDPRPLGAPDWIVERAQQIAGMSEPTARAAMTGRADPHALVQALAQTELAVETAVTVRDKVAPLKDSKCLCVVASPGPEGSFNGQYLRVVCCDFFQGDKIVFCLFELSI